MSFLDISEHFACVIVSSFFTFSTASAVFPAFADKKNRDLLKLFSLFLIIHNCSLTTEQGNSHAALVVDHGQELYKSDLPRRLHMGTAAGTGITARNADDTDSTGEFFLLR